MPIPLSDSQFLAVIDAATALSPTDRDAFVAAVAAKLQGQPIGDGTIGRAIREVQAAFPHPEVEPVPPRWARTVTLPPRVGPQTATSTQPRTAMFTKTTGTVGSKPKEPRTLIRNPLQLIRERRGAARLPQGAGESSKRAAGHPPLAETVGNPDKRALEVPKVAAVADEANDATSNKINLGNSVGKYRRSQED